MLERLFTFEEIQPLQLILNKYWLTTCIVSNDADILLGHKISAFVASTLEDCKNVLFNNVKQSLNVEIDEEVLKGLTTCLHYKYCNWPVPESSLYIQFTKFIGEFVTIKDVETLQEIIDSIPTTTSTTLKNVKNAKNTKEKV